MIPREELASPEQPRQNPKTKYSTITSDLSQSQLQGRKTSCSINTFISSRLNILNFLPIPKRCVSPPPSPQPLSSSLSQH